MIVDAVLAVSLFMVAGLVPQRSRVRCFYQEKIVRHGVLVVCMPVVLIFITLIIGWRIIGLKIRLICFFLILACASGCVATKVRKAKGSVELVSLPDVRQRIVDYHKSGKYREDVSHKAENVADVAIKAIKDKVKYPAVIMVVEDVLLSTYAARKKEIFSANSAAAIDLESHVILSTLPAVEPSVVLFNFLQQRNIPVFLVSYRPEGFRIPIMENLSKSGFSGWQKLFMMPPNYPEGSNYCEEVRKGLQGGGYKIIATVGVLPEDVSGQFAGTAILYPNNIYSER